MKELKSVKPTAPQLQLVGELYRGEVERTMAYCYDVAEMRRWRPLLIRGYVTVEQEWPFAYCRITVAGREFCREYTKEKNE